MGAAPITVTFTGFAGVERTMHVRHLSHREFFETLHLAITVGVNAFTPNGKMSLLEIIKNLEFETFEKMATKLLKGSVFEGVGQLDDPFGTDYFRKFPDELYLATYHALTALHPDLYSKLKAEVDRKSATVSAPQNADATGDQ